jgi:hypothetical protein
MKSCHAAALALMGWYLMIPPPKTTRWTRYWFGQLRDWQVANSFDTAKECEDYRRQMIASTQSDSRKPQNTFEYPPADAVALGNGRIYSPSAKKIYDSNPTAVCLARNQP